MSTQTSYTSLQGADKKKSVAIMTWYAYRNYGTALQAAAISYVVAKLGYLPHFVSYDPKKSQSTMPVAKRPLIQRVTGKAKRFLSPRPLAVVERDAAFDRFIDANLEFTETLAPDRLAELSDRFDAFVCGSDQIWSPRFLDPRYYLDFVTQPLKKVAYAPSFGCEHINDEDKAERIASLLREFGSIAVREKSGADIVEELTGKRPQVVLDPTLLLDANAWSGLSRPYPVTEEPYCLFYFLGSNRGNMKAARRIAKSSNLRVFEVPVFQNRQGRPGVLGPDVGPAEFVSLVKGASLVCTDSFHGMVFSTLFEKPFVPFERFDPNDPASQNTRVYNFLNMTGLDGILLSRSRLTDWRKLANPQIDYRAVRKRVAARREESLRYLRDALGNAARVTSPS